MLTTISTATRRLCSAQPETRRAVEDLASQLGAIEPGELAGLVIFRSSHYQDEELSRELLSHFSCPIVGCTTAGEICQGYQHRSLVAVAFLKTHFAFHTLELEQLEIFEDDQLKRREGASSSDEAPSLWLCAQPRFVNLDDLCLS